MLLYEILFLIATLMFLPAFIFWILSEFFPQKGLDSIYAAFTYPAIIIVICASILAMLVEELSLDAKLMFGAIALLWFVSYRILDSPSKTKSHKIIAYIFQLLSLAGAALIINACYLIHL